MLWSALALLPVLNALSITFTYGANRPHIEEWFGTAPIALAVHDGTFSFSQLMEPINEHPYLITKLILALHTGFSRYNLHIDFFISVLINILIGACIWWMLWQQGKRLALVLAPALSALIFTSRQAINWLVAFQNIFFISALFIVAILLIIQYAKVGWRTLLLAASLASIGSFSMGVAPLLWLAPLVALWLRGYRRWEYYVVWCVLAAVLILRSVLSVIEPLSPPLPLDQVSIIIHFALAFLGSPFTKDLQTATEIGIVGIILFVFNALLLWWRRPEWLGSWAGLAAFGVGSALLTGYGRWAFGLRTALAERYVTHGVLFWCALTVIAAMNVLLPISVAREKALIKLPIAVIIVRLKASARWLQRLVYTMNGIAGIGLGLLFVSTTSASIVPDFRSSLECLRAFPTERNIDCAIGLAATSNNLLPVLVRIDQLAVRHLGVFADHAVTIRDQVVTIPLERFYGAPSGVASDSRFTTWEIDAQTYTVFFQHPPAKHVWRLWFQHIHVPVHFEAGLYVAPPQSDLPVDGVTFRIYGQIPWEEKRTLLFEGHYDPRVQNTLVPIRVSLAPYNNRLAVLHLWLEADGGETLNYDWAMWVEPRLTVELTEEAARAKYYPPN